MSDESGSQKAAPEQDKKSYIYKEAILCSILNFSTTISLMTFSTFRDSECLQMQNTSFTESNKDGNYELDIDLPGFKKDEISLTLDNGYLVVGACKMLNEEEKDDKGKLLRQERYSGAMQRSFYVGEGIDENDVKAKFEDGVLRLTFPKEKEPELPEKKTIMIEG